MTERTKLIALAGRLRGARVLCVGDVVLDRFIYGEVERISPEAPIPVLSVRRRETMLGSAGNVVHNIASLGASPHLIALIGDDDAGGEVVQLLGELGSASNDLLIDSDRPTSIKTRFLAANQQMMRADEERIAPLTDDFRDKLLAAAKTAIETSDVMVLSDYGKGVLRGGTAAALIKLARAAGKPVIVDPKGSDFSIYTGATIITPNRDELEAASRLPTETDEEVVIAARRLIADHNIDMVLATRSADGMTLVRGSGDPVHLGTEAREVFDVSGAGDTVMAALATSLAAGGTLEDSAALANVAASIVVGKVGTATVYPDDLAAGLSHQDLSRAEAKVLALEPARDRVAQWRRAGLKVGFTNGCFDLLHPGHIRLLSSARAACDRLVLGLNDDASVKRLKGQDRPIQSEMSRAAVLASLACVDLVVVFSEDTPLRLIDTLHPDVLVKGADYSGDQVVGAKEVQGWGGQVVLVDLEEGHSTSDTISRMAN
jgi:D-beta-D-heptose 7-phosphate kinase/D-beta-D-heptose 1-phosphate adenosyltransferase